jgi:hypothetical protein
MLLSSLALTVVLTGAITPVESGMICPNKEAGIQHFIETSLTRQRYKSKGYRKTMSTKLAARIVIEAKRFGLDPLVLASIAWVETGFKPTVRGRYAGRSGTDRRMNEAGVFQLIRWDSMVKVAAHSIAGCKSPKLSRWQREVWSRRYRDKTCLYPDIAATRTRVGHFNRRELKDITISTFVVSLEIRAHIESCKARNPDGHRWYSPRWFKRWRKANPNVNVTALERYLHYNWGPKQFPRNHYRRKLFVCYSKIRREVCGPTKRVAVIITP